MDFDASPRVRRSQVLLKGEFEPEKNYRVTAVKGLPGLGGAILTQETSRDILIPDYRRGVEFGDTRGYLSPDGNGRILLISANLEKAAHGAGVVRISGDR